MSRRRQQIDIDEMRSDIASDPKAWKQYAWKVSHRRVMVLLYNALGNYLVTDTLYDTARGTVDVKYEGNDGTIAAETYNNL